MLLPVCLPFVRFKVVIGGGVLEIIQTKKEQSHIHTVDSMSDKKKRK
jgi:hypothetical protein